jgi:CRP/FNR family cyclic AMP-dependent transcriptional regulator
MAVAGGEPNFFAMLAPEARRQALARARALRVRKGQTVVARGANSTEVFFVLEGRLEVVLYSADGREVLLRSLRPGDMFGELAAIDGQHRSASIVAQTDGRLMGIGRSDFRAAVDSSAALGAWLSEHLVAQIRIMTERLFELSALNVQSRLHCELLRIARAGLGPIGVTEVRPAPTHAELASRIGTHREAVTREMRALAERNIVRGGRRRLEFLDIPSLEAAVVRLGADTPDIVS